jgi:tetratricopeptide (TPR) repeat protein
MAAEPAFYPLFFSPVIILLAGIYRFASFRLNIPCMKQLFYLISLLCVPAMAFSQFLTLAPEGGNKKASVNERIGLTDVTIHYDRPGVKGREGKIWGQLVHVGFSDPGFGSSKSSPWRAGANENTTIEFSGDVKIEGQPLPAGKYGFFIAYGPDECTLIFSKNANSWGAYYYNEKEDALRVKVKPAALEKSVEWLKYEFLNETESAATIALQWEKLMVPFKVEVDYISDQLASFRHELRTDKGFTWESWNQAALWCVQHKINLEEALLWSDTATGSNFGGERSFSAWSTKAQVLQQMGRNAAADATIKKALPLASMNEMHQYGRQLLELKRNKEALDIFKQNFDKNPGELTPVIGLVRGYAANADYRSALKYANQALTMSPSQGNKANIQRMIARLSEGKDINW